MHIVTSSLSIVCLVCSSSVITNLIWSYGCIFFVMNLEHRRKGEQKRKKTKGKRIRMKYRRSCEVHTTHVYKKYSPSVDKLCRQMFSLWMLKADILFILNSHISFFFFNWNRCRIVTPLSWITVWTRIFYWSMADCVLPCDTRELYGSIWILCT
jgi:hypothetical protein